ncbi:MAG: Na/Pi cotransporter family protein [bacterium]
MNSADIVTHLQIGPIITGLLGGLALFLFGMEQMTDALKAVAGGSLKRSLARLTTNRFKAAFTGAFVTAVIQSSSVTTVLVVGFISAGLITLSQSIGIIMGANIGSTVTAQVIAFKITHYSLVMIAIGFGLQFFFKSGRIQRYGSMIMGFGLLFFGMELMSDSTRDLRTYQPFIDRMQQMGNPLMGILIGTVFTALVQSSAVTTGIVIVLAGQGVISLEAGIALAFGANIGTCITALLAAIGKPRGAMQAAAIHIVFNVLGVAAWFGFIDQLADFVRWFSPSAENLQGAAKLAAETPRQIANAHTVFNVANTLIFIWFAAPMAWLVDRLVPERKSTGPEPVRPKFLTEVLFETPAVALDCVRMELGRLGEWALRMVREAPQTVLLGRKEDLAMVAKMDDDVDALHEAIITFMGRLSRKELTDAQAERLHDYLEVANYIENMGDTIETNMVTLGIERLERGIQMDESAIETTRPLCDKVVWSVEKSLEALSASDAIRAGEVIEAKSEINRLANDAHYDLMHDLASRERSRPGLFRIESDIIENLKRVYYFSKRIAKAIIEAEAANQTVEYSET